MGKVSDEVRGHSRVAPVRRAEKRVNFGIFFPMTERMPACENGCGDREAVYHFCFPADVEAIPPVLETIAGLARAEMPADKEMEVTLAVQEALANAVVHGCHRDPSKTVDCWVAHGPKGFLIVVRDPGPGFDPEAIPSPLQDQQLGSDHGRGIHMIRQLMDEVHFQRNGAEIHMCKS